MENRDRIYNTFIQNTKFVVDLMLQAYETGLPTNFTIEIKESTVKAISKEETYSINSQLDELREDIINGTMIECFQNGKTFAFKRKVNIVPVK